MAAIITRRRITADEYHRMGETGILRRDERIEPIDGEIVEMPPVGTPHMSCVAFLGFWLNGGPEPQSGDRLSRAGRRRVPAGNASRPRCRPHAAGDC